MPLYCELPEKNLLQAYGIVLLKKKHKLINKLQQEHAPSLHGHKTWLSSFLLMDYLLHKQLLTPKRQVLELGCGWGPAAIFCAHHGGCKVTGLDRDKDVFPFLQAQATLNEVKVKTLERGFEDVDAKLLKDFDLVFGADVCFWEELVDMHLKIIKHALATGVKEIIYTDPGRSTFLKLAKKAKKKFNAELFHWYCSEPEQFDGYVLHIRAEQQSAAKPKKKTQQKAVDDSVRELKAPVLHLQRDAG